MGIPRKKIFYYFILPKAERDETSSNRRNKTHPTFILVIKIYKKTCNTY
jgi:hypothetical protein